MERERERELRKGGSRRKGRKKKNNLIFPPPPPLPFRRPLPLKSRRLRKEKNPVGRLALAGVTKTSKIEGTGAIKPTQSWHHSIGLADPMNDFAFSISSRGRGSKIHDRATPQLMASIFIPQYSGVAWHCTFYTFYFAFG